MTAQKAHRFSGRPSDQICPNTEPSYVCKPFQFVPSLISLHWHRCSKLILPDHEDVPPDLPLVTKHDLTAWWLSHGAAAQVGSGALKLLPPRHVTYETLGSQAVQQPTCSSTWLSTGCLL